MSVCHLALEALHAQSIESKLSLLNELKIEFEKQGFKLGEAFAQNTAKASSLNIPSYANFCTITHPTRIRRPKVIKSPQSLAKVLHSIAHIEYSAIDLALDALTRFVSLPPQFYNDWLEVALQEGTHFCLLRENLHHLGYEYGDFAVHTQLFDAQAATLNLTERMALIHRGLEANGLDANPYVRAKVQAYEHTHTTHILQALDIILHDEIEHVRKGDRWWRYASTQTSPQDFIHILRRFEYLAPLPRVLNIQARLLAGYKQEELAMLASKSPIS